MMQPGWMQRGLALAIFAVMGGQASLAWALEFSAERILKDRGKVVVSHVNAVDDRWRLEYQQPQAGAMAVIVRLDRQIAWLILSKRRLYLEVPIKKEHLLFVNTMMEGEVSRERIGTETLNGYPTDLFEVKVSDQGAVREYYQWVTQMHRFPIKTVSKQGDWSLEYRRVIFTSQSPFLFELPQRLDRGIPPVESQR